MTSVPRGKATAVLHEWQTESLASVSQNAQLEGDAASADAASATSRLSNTCQISTKIPRVTGTQEAVVKAGRARELAHQIVKTSKELRREMEGDLLSNNAEVAGDSTTAREHGGIEAWIQTNTAFGTGGTTGSAGNTARSDGTNRVFTETLLKTVLRATFNAGGDPDCIMVGAFNKQQMSTFTGNATRQVNADDRKLYAAIDLYQSDFGDLEIIPNRFMVAESCLILQKDLWAVSYLRPVQVERLAKTGDSEWAQIITEYTLEARNEAGSGAVFDLTTS